MIIETFPVGPLQCNCTILGDPETGEAIIIDPGDEAPKVLRRLKAHGLKPKAILITHTHLDHVAGNHEVREQTGAKVMFAPYAVVGDSFRAEKPQIWSPGGYRALGNNYPYDLHPDGKRLALIAAADEAGAVQDKVVFFFGFGDYLKKIAPVTKPSVSLPAHGLGLMKSPAPSGGEGGARHSARLDRRNHIAVGCRILRFLDERTAKPVEIAGPWS